MATSLCNFKIVQGLDILNECFIMAKKSHRTLLRFKVMIDFCFPSFSLRNEMSQVVDFAKEV